MIQTKLVRLYPTDFSVDFLYGNKDECTKYLKDNYKITNESYDCNFDCSFVEDLRNIKDERVIICYLINTDIGILVHESVHILEHLSEIINMKLNTKAQEIRATFTEYIFNSFYTELLDIKSKEITNVEIEESKTI